MSIYKGRNFVFIFVYTVVDKEYKFLRKEVAVSMCNFFFKPFVCAICLSFCVFSCNDPTKIKPKPMSGTEYKSVSRILKDARKVNVHSDIKICRSLTETISKRSAIELLALSTQEKNEILQIAITATIDLQRLFKTVSAKVADGLANSLKDDSALKKELLKSVDLQLDMTAVKVILSDAEYLKDAEIDSVLFGIALLLGNTMGKETFENLEEALKDGSSKRIVDVLSKTNVEVVLFSYGIVRKREDVQKMTFAGVKLIDLLPEMKVNF